jgi:hypothetical protein
LIGAPPALADWPVGEVDGLLGDVDALPVAVVGLFEEDGRLLEEHAASASIAASAQRPATPLRVGAGTTAFMPIPPQAMSVNV